MVKIFNQSLEITDENKELLMAKYKNNLSVWSVFEEKNYFFEVRNGDKLLRRFKRLNECNAFVDGMEEYAKQKGEFFTQEEIEKIPYDVQKLREQLVQANREKEEAKKLAEKLIKGIVNSKKKQNQEEIKEIIRQMEEKVDV